MKIGKLSESALQKVVFEQLHTRREEVLVGPGIGEDCAALKLQEGEVFVTSTDPITGTAQDIGTLAIQITANDLASAGAEPVGVLLTVLLPPEIEEPDLREMMQQVEAACAKAGVQVMGGHTEITAVVNQPVISVCGVGKVKDGCLISTGGAKPGMDILVTKWIGIEGTSIIENEQDFLHLLSKMRKNWMYIYPCFQRPQSPFGLALVLCMTSQRAVSLVHSGKWQKHLASDLKSI